MKSKNGQVLRRIASLVAGIALLLGSGCLEKRLVWSPDGSRAAVIGSEGLYLCDADGRLTGLVVPQAVLAAWLPDSRSLVVVRKGSTRSLAVVQAALGEERAKLEAQAEELWAKLRSGAHWSVLGMELNTDKSLIKFLFFRRHADELKTRLTPAEWAELAALEIATYDLVSARVAGDQVTLGPVVCQDVREIAEVRVPPNGLAVAWTRARLGAKDQFELLVATLDGAAPKIVARNTAAYPDWDLEGRSLVYVETSTPAAPDADDAIVLGVLMKRAVLDSHGRLSVAGESQYLAGMLFHMFTHVRCLHDGRVLFNAVEMTLPISTADFVGDHREQLFAVDPARQSTVVRLIPRPRELELPNALAFFEVSPDDRQVVFGGMNGEVALLTLPTGEVTILQGPTKESEGKGVPTWRVAGELTYVKRIASKNGQKPARPLEVVLRKGDQETLLSQTWNTDVLQEIVGGK